MSNKVNTPEVKLRPSYPLFQLWTFSLCIHCKTKQKVADFIKKIRGFSTFKENRILLEANLYTNFLNFDHL